MKLEAVAEHLGGKLMGDGQLEVTAVMGIEQAAQGHITFVLPGGKTPDAIAATCLIIKQQDESLDMAQIVMDDPQMGFVKALELLHPTPEWPEGIDACVHESARLGTNVKAMTGSYVSASAVVGDNTVLCPGVYIGPGVTVGTGCLLYPNVSLMDGTRLGDNVIIHAGTVIGSDGFGYLQRDGQHVKVPQRGGVVIEDYVEIGSNCSIDRATTGNTTIGAGTKIDNLVQVAHNVTIGKGVILVGQCGIAGSTKIGNGAMIGGQAAIADHVNIADGVMLAGRSGVMSDIHKRGIYAGAPEQKRRDWLKSSSLFKRLPELHERIKELERKLEDKS